MDLSFVTSTSGILLLCLTDNGLAASGGVIGVDYGRVADNLPSPGRVVDLLKTNGIGAVRIYDTNVEVLRALSGSGIKVAVALPNDKLAGATNPDVAGTWVWENIGKYYPNTQIHAIAVGNEVFHQRPDLSSSIVPAMWNVYNALNNLGLAGAIKVSSPVAFSAVAKSFPPSEGIFRQLPGDLQPVVRQMLDFIRRTDSFFMINLYPYITYMENPGIDLNYALGLPNNGVRDPRTGLMYYSLLDAQLDAVYSGMAALGFGDHLGNSTARALGAAGKKLAIKETGHPTRLKWPLSIIQSSPEGRRRSGMEEASLSRERGPSAENAQAYNGNLIERILAGRTGTPLHPDADMDIYIFSLFNENLKEGPEVERNFGIFYPDGTKVYDIDFRPAEVGARGA
ncbi:unnamed protein product [Spirodela intermedia]|uniref:Uncharacterized protein n=1 Tax=Spirodela intermedia TaxID=51605 RepID=A0A7I8IHI2_SPIIN|nr:unnamed protein product [Spirodela intermedia]CAA6656533.1 unnamed protein product [Spirodela intermedia]